MEEGFQDVWGFEDDLGSEEQFQPDLPEAHKAYHKNLLDRFELINQYCDCSTVEPVTFNSVNKIWYIFLLDIFTNFISQCRDNGLFIYCKGLEDKMCWTMLYAMRQKETMKMFQIIGTMSRKCFK